MNKPYIICHMMTSLDGRIDCVMTEKLPGVGEYYTTLNSFEAPTRVSGRVTAELEMALKGKFHNSVSTPLGKVQFHRAVEANGYEVVLDTRGTLLWNDQLGEERPLIVVTSMNVSLKYLDYLNKRHISWIVCGENHIDLKKTCDILANEFGVKRMVVVGGGHINAGFLEAGLLDEVSILIGAGIDGRDGMTAVFDGLAMERPVTPLKLLSVESFDSGVVWIRYRNL